MKSGDYFNEHPNDNGPNEKLKSLYNEMKSECMLKYGTPKHLPHHMISILVESLDAFKVSDGKFIRGSFVKTNIPPSYLPT